LAGEIVGDALQAVLKGGQRDDRQEAPARLLRSVTDSLTGRGPAYDAACGTQALLILTEWDEFRGLHLGRLCKLMHVPVIVDGRNVLEPEAVRRAGFEYCCFGRVGAPYSQSELIPMLNGAARSRVQNPGYWAA
jgi:hypothetical protein